MRFSCQSLDSSFQSIFALRDICHGQPATCWRSALIHLFIIDQPLYDIM